LSGLRLSLRARPPARVDGSALLPEKLQGQTLDAIRRIALPGWNEFHEVGELFEVSGEATDRLQIDQLDGSFDRLGALATAGTLVLRGQAGDLVGEGLRGASIEIEGAAGDYLGCGMRRGRIEVRGNAGHFAGSGRAGELQGMSGGTLLVRGDVGDRAADRMRRGLLLVEGDAGDYLASRMLAGTVVLLGRAAGNAGYLMRRGTVVLDQRPAQMLPTFNANGRQDLLAIQLLLRSLGGEGPRFSRLAARAGGFERWLGDLAASGQGELLVSF